MGIFAAVVFGFVFGLAYGAFKRAIARRCVAAAVAAMRDARDTADAALRAVEESRARLAAVNGLALRAIRERQTPAKMSAQDHWTAGAAICRDAGMPICIVFYGDLVDKPGDPDWFRICGGLWCAYPERTVTSDVVSMGQWFLIRMARQIGVPIERVEIYTEGRAKAQVFAVGEEEEDEDEEEEET